MPTRRDLWGYTNKETVAPEAIQHHCARKTRDSTRRRNDSKTPAARGGTPKQKKRNVLDLLDEHCDALQREYKRSPVKTEAKSIMNPAKCYGKYSTQVKRL